MGNDYPQSKMSTARKTALIRAAMELAQRSDNTKWHARIHASEYAAAALLHKSYLQMLGSLRLMRWAGNYSQ